LRSGSNVSSAYRPRVRDPLLLIADLFGSACDRCTAVHLCGEVNEPTSCHALRAFAGGWAHPDDPDMDSGELEFPSEGFEWGPLPDLAPTLAIAPPWAPVGPCRMVPLATALTNRVVPQSRPVGASLVGRDERLVRLWLSHGDLGPRLAGLGYSYLISAAISTWSQSTPLGGLYAVARSMALASLLSRHLSTIPTLAWRNSRDIERQIEWLCTTGTAPRTIAVDLGTRSAEQFQWLLEGLSIISAEIDRPPMCRLVAHGVSNLARVSQVAGTWPGPVSFASSHPALVGLHGRLLRDDLTTTDGSGLSRDACAAANVEIFERVVATVLLGRETGARSVA
jgi:hypothetical protein